MNNLLVILFTTLNLIHWSDNLDPENGLTYIEAADEIISDGIHTDEIIDLKNLFVLASVIDPRLRIHSLRGLIHIENDSERKNELISLITSENALLIPEVVHSKTLLLNYSKDIRSFLDIFNKIRKGNAITPEDKTLIKRGKYLDILTS